MVAECGGGLVERGAWRSAPFSPLPIFLLTFSFSLPSFRSPPPPHHHPPTQAMERAHVGALLSLAAPFQQRSGVFDFGAQTASQEVRDQIPTMLRYRLTPPPEETYSLHRKLSGFFLLCRFVWADGLLAGVLWCSPSPRIHRYTYKHTYTCPPTRNLTTGSKLQARIPCRAVFEQYRDGYRFD